MMQWMPEGQNILDVGSSSGYFGEKLIAAKKDKVWGVELDPKDAQAARERGYQKVYEGNLDDFDWSVAGRQQFDGIIFADVLEHVKDPLAVLKGAQTVLAPGGYIYISTPNVAHITVRVMLLEGNFDYEDRGILDNTHLRFFTRKNLLQLFYDAGMEVTQLDARVDDPPTGQVKRHMEQLGLTPGKKFDALLDSAEARAFQFVLAARMSHGRPKKPPELALPSRLSDDWPVIAKKMNDDDQHIKHLERHGIELQQRLDSAESKLAAIHKRPLRWLATSAARKVVRRAKPQK
jgi:2-polyprenyl-3-methyl-5-hydroxy-6-metoxy-1,4-benzoquinol methylase